MRRPIAAIAGTVAGLAALLSYKSGAPPARLTASSPGAAATSPGAAATTDGTTGTTPPTTSAPASGSTTHAVTGSLVTTRYGGVQVRATVQGSRLLDVTAVQLPSDRQRSAQISNQAAPLLRQEALAAQSANIQGVSGATYTSQGYADSLQSALDAARQG